MNPDCLTCYYMREKRILDADACQFKSSCVSIQLGTLLYNKRPTVALNFFLFDLILSRALQCVPSVCWAAFVQNGTIRKSSKVDLTIDKTLPRSYKI